MRVELAIQRTPVRRCNQCVLICLGLPGVCTEKGIDMWHLISEHIHHGNFHILIYAMNKSHTGYSTRNVWDTGINIRDVWVSVRDIAKNVWDLIVRDAGECIDGGGQKVATEAGKEGAI